MRELFALVALMLLSVASIAEGALFPEPLHLRREIHDPISGTTTTIDEYCAGDRIITVRGSLVVIADYGRGELTEIDRDAATFSVTRLTDVARANDSLPRSREVLQTVDAEPRVLAPQRSHDGRALETYEFTRESGAERTTVRVAVDRQVALSAAAVEVLVGAAFPNTRTFAHEAALRAAAPAGDRGRRMQTDSAPSFGLPSEQSFTHEVAGERVTLVSKVVLVDRAAPPADLVTIPAGARQIESRLLSLPRILNEIDNLPPPRP